MTLAQMSFCAFMMVALSASALPPKPSPTPPAAASPTPAPSPKSQYNTHVLEAAEDFMTFTDVVRIVRDYEGQSEVLFVSKTGVFTGPSDSQALNLLIESQSSQTPVTVRFNESSRQITRVSKAKAAEPGR